LKVGDTFQAEVMGLSPTGDGVVKTDSKVIFVPLAIPGQKIVGKIIRRKKRVFFGETEEVIKKSPHEENPKDPEFPHHGGAPWQCIEYKEQLKWKEQFVRDAFERIAGIQDPPVEEIVESPITERYRNKMEFSFGHSQMRTETDEQGNKTHFDEQPGLGLHRRGNWREIVRITDTCLASKEMMNIKDTIEHFAMETGKPVWNPIRNTGFWRHVTVRESHRTGEMLINIQVAEEMDDDFWEPLRKRFSQESTSPDHPFTKEWSSPCFSKRGLGGDFSQIIGITITVYGGNSVAPFDAPTKTIFGRDHFFERFCGLVFKISHNAFFQVNTESAEKLTETIAEYAGLHGSEHVLDLFCGTGSLGLSVAKHCQSVTGIEVIASAIRDAQENAKRNEVQNTEFIAGPVENVLPEVLQRKHFDAVIVDPPRAGLTKKARKLIGNLPVKKIILVSCNPATLARDLLQFEEMSWKLKRARAHDLFPHTPHVETVAEIVKNEECKMQND
jgi:23S rRNA (uracil1939-C5)-methyltransferase